MHKPFILRSLKILAVSVYVSEWQVIKVYYYNRRKHKNAFRLCNSGCISAHKWEIYAENITIRNREAECNTFSNVLKNEKQYLLSNFTFKNLTVKAKNIEYSDDAVKNWIMDKSDIEKIIWGVNFNGKICTCGSNLRIIRNW